MSDIFDTAEVLRLKVAKQCRNKCKTLNDAIKVIRSKCSSGDPMVRSLNALNHAVTGLKHFDSVDLAEYRSKVTDFLTSLDLS